MEQKIERHLGLRRDRVRDMYGLVEANMLAIECEHQNKHMPPWCRLSIRDVNNVDQEVARGEEGVIALLDATNMSYPGFILTEDIGALVGTECPCGRSGPVVTFYRRMDGREYGCCAVSLEKFIESKEIVESCKVQA
jgi:long-chain-fatty-acid---luciferin-component ligase